MQRGELRESLAQEGLHRGQEGRRRLASREVVEGVGGQDTCAACNDSAFGGATHPTVVVHHRAFVTLAPSVTIEQAQPGGVAGLVEEAGPLGVAEGLRVRVKALEGLVGGWR